MSDRKEIQNEMEEFAFGPDYRHFYGYIKRLDEYLPDIFKYLGVSEEVDLEKIRAEKRSSSKALLLTLHSMLYTSMASHLLSTHLVDFGDYWRNLSHEEKIKLRNNLYAIWFSTLLAEHLTWGKGKVEEYSSSEERMKAKTAFIRWISWIGNFFSVDIENLKQEMNVCFDTFNRGEYLLPNIFIMRILKAINSEEVKHIDWNNFAIASEAELLTYFPNGLPWSTIENTAVVNILIDEAKKDIREKITKGYDGSPKSLAYIHKNGGCLVPIVSVIASLLFVLVL